MSIYQHSCMLFFFNLLPLRLSLDTQQKSVLSVKCVIRLSTMDKTIQD